MTDGIKIIGDDELLKELNALGARTEKSYALKSLRAGGKHLVKQVKARVPVRSGTLRRSIGQVTRSGRFGGGKFGAHVTVTNRKGANRRFNGWYGHFLEFGTSPHSNAKSANLSVKGNKKDQSGKRQHPGTKAQPFFRPAWDQEKDNVLKLIGSKLWELIRGGR